MSLELSAKICEGTPAAKVKNGKQILYISAGSDKIHKLGKECPFCEKVFTSRQSLIYHIKHSCHKKDDGHNNFHVELADDEEFRLLPQMDRDIIFLWGPPNCGKTFFVNEYAKAFHRLFPNRPIILISSVSSDDTLKNNEKMYNRILINDDMMADPFDTLNDFADSLVIFDDIENSQHPKAIKYLYSVLDELIKNGRHAGEYGASIIFTNQQARMGQKTKCILENASKYVVFPSVCSPYHLTNLLLQYIGMTKKDVTYLRNSGARWAILNKSVPRYIITNKEAYILDKYIY